MKFSGRYIPVIIIVAIAIALLYYGSPIEGYQTTPTTTTSTVTTPITLPESSTFSTLLNLPRWLVITFVVILFIMFIVSGLMTAYNWYIGIKAGAGAVTNVGYGIRNVSSGAANWLRGKRANNPKPATTPSQNL